MKIVAVSGSPRKNGNIVPSCLDVESVETNGMKIANKMAVDLLDSWK
jgi:hypothetical protein